MARDPDLRIGLPGLGTGCLGQDLNLRAGRIGDEIVKLVGDFEFLWQPDGERMIGVKHLDFKLAKLVMAPRSAADQVPVILREAVPVIPERWVDEEEPF